VQTSFYSENELVELGLKSYGKNVLISRKVSIYSASNISVGNNVRVDDFCILSGNLTINNNVHIAGYVAIFAGNSGVEIDDFVGISSRSAIYAESDDYGGDFLTNPTVAEQYKHIISGKVILKKHSILGTGCTVLPGVTIGEGVAVGSMSLVNKNLEPWGMYVGIPCKLLKLRSKKLLELEKEMHEES